MFQSNRTHLPFLYQRMSGQLTAEDLRQIEELMQWVKGQKGRRLYSVVDCRTAERPDGLMRSQLADVLRRNAPDERRDQVSVMVFSNRLVSGAMTALRWLVPASNTEVYVSSLDEAVKAIEKHAAQDGVAVPAGYRALLRELLVEAPAP